LIPHTSFTPPHPHSKSSWAHHHCQFLELYARGGSALDGGVLPVVNLSYQIHLTLHHTWPLPKNPAAITLWCSAPSSEQIFYNTLHWHKVYTEFDPNTSNKFHVESWDQIYWQKYVISELTWLWSIAASYIIFALILSKVTALC
jgi:hypothetical protein